MITKRESKLSRMMIVIQVVFTVILFLVTEYFFSHPVFNLKEKIAILFQIILIWSVLMYKFRLGIIFRADTFASMIRGYLVTVSLGAALLFSEIELLPFMRRIPDSLEYVVLFGCFDLAVLISFKVVFYYLMRYLRKKGYNSRHVIIVADSIAVPFIDSFIRAKDWGYKIAAIISPDKELQGKYEKIHIVESQEALKKYITQQTIDDIFYCMPIDDDRFNLEQLIQDSEEIGVTLHIMQQEYLHRLNNDVNIYKSFDKSFVTYSAAPHSYISIKVKDAIDVVFSIIALIALLPLMVLIAGLIKLGDGGPVFFKQERIGLNGRRFNCYKFRSMVINAESLIERLQDLNESDGPTFKIENDPRITKLGRLLRKTSLDELPQFYNVIKGEMSVVGPRPPLLREVQQYERSQLRRLSMKPGITCIWQVWGRNQVSFKEWMRMDLEYIDNWSLWLDFKIIIATVGVILKANGQ